MAQNICLGPFYIFFHEKMITYPLRVCDLDPEEGMINDHAIVYQEETIVFAGNTTDIGFFLFYGKLCVVNLLSHCCGPGIHIIFSAAGFLKNYLHHPNPTSPNHQI